MTHLTLFDDFSYNHLTNNDDKNCILTKEVKIGAYGGNNNHLIFSIKIYNDGNLTLFKNDKMNEISSYKNNTQKELSEQIYNQVEHLPEKKQLSQEKINMLLDLKEKMAIVNPHVADEGNMYTPSSYYTLHNMKTKSGKNIDFKFCSSGSGLIITMGPVYKLNTFFHNILGIKL